MMTKRTVYFPVLPAVSVEVVEEQETLVTVLFDSVSFSSISPRHFTCTVHELVHGQCSTVTIYQHIYRFTQVLVSVQDTLFVLTHHELSERIDRGLCLSAQHVLGIYTVDAADQIAAFLQTSRYNTFILGRRKKCCAIVGFAVSDEFRDSVEYKL